MKGHERTKGEQAGPAASGEDTKPQRAPLRSDWLSGLTGFHVRLAHASLYRHFSRAMAELKLTQKQTAVLELIAANPGCSQVDLAASLGMDRATMMALVEGLEKRGLIGRSISIVDRRRHDLHLTELGADTVARARAVIDRHEAELLDGWSDQERRAFVAALKRFRGKFGPWTD
jgi:DNA-binding MarR family transcriptional regulator